MSCKFGSEDYIDEMERRYSEYHEVECEGERREFVEVIVKTPAGKVKYQQKIYYKSEKKFRVTMGVARNLLVVYMNNQNSKAMIDTIISEMSELRNKLVELGNMTEIKVTLPTSDPTYQLAIEWESLLDKLYDEVSDLAYAHGVKLPE